MILKDSLNIFGNILNSYTCLEIFQTLSVIVLIFVLALVMRAMEWRTQQDKENWSTEAFILTDDKRVCDYVKPFNSALESCGLNHKVTSNKVFA